MDQRSGGFGNHYVNTALVNCTMQRGLANPRGLCHYLIPMNESTRSPARAELRLSCGSVDPRDANLAAWARLQRGDFVGALTVLEAAIAVHPREPHSLNNSAMILRRLGRLSEAMHRCDAAIAVAPDFTPAWLERGFILRLGGEARDAAASFKEVLRLDPDEPDAHAALAGLAIKRGDIAAGHDHASRALRVRPDHAEAMLAYGRIAIQTGNPSAALTLAETERAKSAPPSEERIAFATLSGDAYDRLGDSGRAFAAYQSANDDFRAIHEADRNDRLRHRVLVERITEQVAMTDPIDWPSSKLAATAIEEPPHVFVLGYPRSGNTLVENVLASIPGVIALEERPTLALAENQWLVPEDGIARLLAAGEDDLDASRAAYWEKARAAGWSPGRPLVDMDPLKTITLPLIARLFPRARIVFVRRDPRDVVLSCFRTNFVLTSAALEFTTLDDAASHYDAMMRLAHVCVERMPLELCWLDYHRLIADFDAQTRALCAFAGLPWSEGLREFEKTAERRGVTTASVAQVRLGLYDGTGQWIRYADQLSPVRHLLDEWAERFGLA